MAKDFYAATEYAMTSIQMLIEATWGNSAVSNASSKADVKMTNGTTPEAPNVL